MNVALVEFVRTGEAGGVPGSLVSSVGTAGLIVSSVHVALAVAPTLPTLSVWRTANVWTPSEEWLTASEGRVFDAGLVHVVHSALSNEHWKLPPASPANVNEAASLLVTASGRAVMLGMAGGVWSIVHVELAGSLALPAESIALIWSV